MHYAFSSQKERARDLLKRHGIMRLSELKALGIHPPTLSRLVEDGTVVRTSRGLYELADAEVDIAHSLAEMTKRVPKGVVCLISATTAPSIPVRAQRPTSENVMWNRPQSPPTATWRASCFLARRRRELLRVIGDAGAIPSSDRGCAASWHRETGAVAVGNAVEHACLPRRSSRRHLVAFRVDRLLCAGCRRRQQP